MRHGAQDPKEAWILISIGEIDFLRTAWEDSAVNVESWEVITTLGLVIWKLPSEKQTGNRVTVDFDDIQVEGGGCGSVYVGVVELLDQLVEGMWYRGSGLECLWI